MKIKLIKKEQIVNRKINESYSVKNILTKDINKGISLAISEGKNHFEKTKNKKSSRVYYILKGKLIIKKDNEELIANKNECVFIPANTVYSFKGTFKAILINSPAFNINDEEIQDLK